MALSTEALAADLAELIYERWMGALEAGAAVDFAAIEALLVLIDGLKTAEDDAATGAMQLRVAAQVLTEMPSLPPREEFQRLLMLRIAAVGARGARRNDVPG